MNSPFVHAAVFSVYLIVIIFSFFVLQSWPVNKWNKRGIVIAMSLLGILLFWFSGPPQIFYDFFFGYYPAGRAALHHDIQALRSVTGVAFVNMPVVAYLFAPLAILSPKAAACCFTLMGVGLAAAAWWILGSLVHASQSGRWMIALMFAASGPLISGIKFGNTSYIILFALVAGLFCLLTKRSSVAGLLLALSAIIKPPLLLFSLFFLVRRDYRGFWAFLGTCLIVAALSVACFGLMVNIEWLDKCILQFRQHWLVGFAVQSIPAFVARVTAPSSVLTDWNPYTPTRSQQLLTNVLVGLFFLVGAAALIKSEWKRLEMGSESGSTIEKQFSLVLCLCLIASPLSWAHYYAWLLLPAVLWIKWQPESRLESWTALTATALTMLPIPWPMMSSNQAFMKIYSAVWESHLLFGGVIWFFLISWKLIQPSQEISPRAESGPDPETLGHRSN